MFNVVIELYHISEIKSIYIIMKLLLSGGDYAYEKSCRIRSTAGHMQVCVAGFTSYELIFLSQNVQGRTVRVHKIRHGLQFIALGQKSFGLFC